MNYIKANPFRSRIFASLCDGIRLQNTAVSHRRPMAHETKSSVDRFVHLRVEIITFIDTEEIKFEFLHNDIWWLRVSFLSDLFGKLNVLNLSLQGSQENYITISCKLKAFKEKLIAWNSKIRSSRFESFPSINENPLKMD